MKNRVKLSIIFTIMGLGVSLQAETPNVSPVQQKKMEQAFKKLPNDLKRDAQAIAKDEARYQRLELQIHKLEKEIKEYQAKKMHLVLVDLKKKELARLKREFNSLGHKLDKKSAWWSQRTRNILLTTGIVLGALGIGYLYYRANHESPKEALETATKIQGALPEVPSSTAAAPDTTTSSKFVGTEGGDSLPAGTETNVLPALPSVKKNKLTKDLSDAWKSSRGDSSSEAVDTTGSWSKNMQESVERGVQAAEPVPQSGVQSIQSRVEPTIKSAAERVQSVIEPAVQKVQSAAGDVAAYGRQGMEELGKRARNAMKTTKEAVQPWAEGVTRSREQDQADSEAIQAELRERGQGVYTEMKERATRGARKARKWMDENYPDSDLY